MNFPELIQQYLNKKELGFSGHILSLYGKPIGLINPATFFGESEGFVHIGGSRGVFNVPKELFEKTLVGALIKAGSLITGPIPAIERLEELIAIPLLSRSAVYFCGCSNDAYIVVGCIEKIRAAAITVFGCGGIGSSAAMVLAGAGIKKINLIDGDVIEESNFNRQLMWTRNDIGRKKVDVLKERINERFPQIIVCADSSSMVTREKIDFYTPISNGILFSADEPLGIGGYGRTIAAQNGIPFVGGGYDHTRGGIYTGGPSELISEDIEWFRGPNSIMPSYGPLNLEIVGRATNILLQTIGELIPVSNREITWDSYDFPQSN